MEQITDVCPKCLEKHICAKWHEHNPDTESEPTIAYHSHAMVCTYCGHRIEYEESHPLHKKNEERNAKNRDNKCAREKGHKGSCFSEDGEEISKWRKEKSHEVSR